MTGAGRTALFTVAMTAAAICHAAPSAQVVSPGAAPASGQLMVSEPLPGVLGPPSGTYGATQVLLPSTNTMTAAAEYRFAGQTTWFVFDRPLYLPAFAGEERAYTLEFRTPRGPSTGTLSYVIDMRAPEAPRFTTAPGDTGQSLVIGFAASGDIRLSVDGGLMSPFDPAAAPSFEAPPDSTRIVRAAAYAIDPAGNASRITRAVWRLSPAGFEPSFPLAAGVDDVPAIVEAPAYTAVAGLVDLAGSIRITLAVPDGAIPCIAVNAADPFGSFASWAQIAGERSSASCLVPFPWGYERETSIHYGYFSGGAIHAVPGPLLVSPRFPANEAILAPASAVVPSVAVDSTMAIVEWPESPWTTYMSTDGSDFSPVLEPVSIALGEAPVSIRYFSIGQNGARSETGSIELPARVAVQVPRLGGVENGRTYSSAVVALPLGTAALRYEASEGSALPGVIGTNSPAVPQEGLRFEGRPGEIVRYRLRLVADAPQSALSAERFISFSIDRQPPPLPDLAQGSISYSASDSTVAFKPLDGTIFVSISEDGLGTFARYDGPITMNGSDDGRKRYIVRAYAEDEFGNRSAEMARRRVLIDRSSLYADARGRSGASGTPDDPIAYLDEAIDAAAAAGKRFVYVRGQVVMRRPATVRGNLTVAGGFDGDWDESPSLSAAVTVRLAPASGTFAFVVDGGSLSLSSLSLSMSGDGAGGLVSARGGSVRITRSSLRVAGGVETVAVRSFGASVEVNSSSVDLSSTVTGRGIDISSADLVVADSSMGCGSSVRLFDAIRISDGRASITGLRVEASPESTLSGVTATRSTVRAERSVLVVRGGAASCRLFGASASSMTVSSTYVDLSWKGSVEAFSATNGSSLRIAHLTAIVDSPRGALIGSSASTFELVNSIASFSGGAPVLVRSDAAPRPGSISANCLWGFSRYLDGAVTASTTADLDRLSAPLRPNLLEEPSRTFSVSLKGLRRLSAASACVDAGVQAGWTSSLDLLGSPRISGRGTGLPDIGAEEL